LPRDRPPSVDRPSRGQRPPPVDLNPTRGRPQAQDRSPARSNKSPNNERTSGNVRLPAESSEHDRPPPTKRTSAREVQGSKPDLEPGA
jgi:hypothetical protein